MGDDPTLSSADGQTETFPPPPPPAATPRKIPSSPRVLPPRTPVAPPLPISSSDPIGGGRFVPGQIIAERYRVVALAGRGGMGEVYRAEDLKLSQIVAIKFLPESLSRDAGALTRFHSEVRVARQVSHPNVCRMFDIGDAGGITFLTMEYVDGEDLASLVRRIGRLSPDKATEIARQICAGLAAAHERGVIHRDLKPANIMLDGAGRVRITDFGLAGIAASIQGAEVRAGTPAYMAPEQLAGREVTVKSDLYSLGLVLYEILTGKRAFDAATLPELMRLREESSPSKPSSIVRDLDPLLERVIMRCLEKDPALRPTSALQVAAALPGGDPLAAALAAGETPSPQMVAAAGDTTGLSPRAALSVLAAVLLGTLFFIYIGVKEDALEAINPSRPSEVMAHHARDILAKLGYTERPADWVGHFSYNYWFLTYINKFGGASPSWKQILPQRPMMLEYWYRESPWEMVPQTWASLLLTPGVVESDEPPPIRPGMATIWMDAEEHLQWLQVIPPEVEPSTSNEADQKNASPPARSFPSVDWNLLFTAAGLDPSQFRPATPNWLSLAAFDQRAAWDGTWPQSGRPLRVEAAAWHGKPVYFSLVSPWTRPNRTPTDADKGSNTGSIIVLIVTLLTVAVGVWFALRNLARGRGDHQNAWRLACIALGIGLATFLFRAHFVKSLEMILLCILAISTSLFMAGTLWVLYIALEPYVRRRWPQTIISWTRLMGGRFRDPLVGRDLVFGVLMGISWVLVYEMGILIKMRWGGAPAFPAQNFLMGARESAGTLLATLVTSILGTLLFFFTLVILRVLVRNTWLAAALFVALYTLPKVLGSNHLVVDLIVWATIYAIAAVGLVRFGLIVLGVSSLLANVLLNLPYSLDFSNWYASQTLFIAGIFVAIGAWGVYTSLAGKPLWKEELFE
ncbi:MAG TPA: serine/threonine-protein kinase [Candidatus Eisenbacteria bacterium]|nr:serine/threonine-protein kinase [Candidatus Eisenbacteria bacterium]